MFADYRLDPEAREALDNEFFSRDHITEAFGDPAAFNAQEALINELVAEENAIQEVEEAIGVWEDIPF